MPCCHFWRRFGLKPVYLVEALRTPQAKAQGALANVPAPYLAHYLLRTIMDKLKLPNDAIDEVIIGNTGTPAKYPNLGRVIALEAGLDKKTSGHSVHRNCASGMQALSAAVDKIQSNRCDLIFAGGCENMTQMPLIYGKEMTHFFTQLMKAKSLTERMKVFLTFKVSHLKPIIAIEQGLTDPFCGKNMGQTAELLAAELGITREQQDEFANHSHYKAVKATKEGKFAAEIIPLLGGNAGDQLISEDQGPRENSSVESLAKMKPYFEKITGTVTVGNSCPITDGGSVLLLASEEALKRYHLTPMARIVDYHFHGLEPERMGMGPLLAMDGVFKRTQLSLSQMDLVEVNEAFAAQCLAVLRALADVKVAGRWGVEKAWGEVDPLKFNVNGGAIALGHPVGSTGSRLVVTLAHELKRRKEKYGVASLCIGGGQGGAVVIENMMS